jgi:Tfp pilus assembly protein PilO
MVKNIFIAILILGFIGSILFLDIPMVQNILSTKKEIKIQQDLLQEKSNFIETVTKLVEKYIGNEDVFKELDLILPDNQDVPGLIVQLEALANDNGVILNDVSFTEEDDEKKISDYKTIKINLKLNGSYEALKNFLITAENNIRLVDIDSISFGASANEKNNTSFDFDLILNTYYQIN